jgi:hypothetical protein
MRAVVATHAIYGYGNQRGAVRVAARGARGTCMPCALRAPMCP